MKVENALVSDLLGTDKDKPPSNEITKRYTHLKDVHFTGLENPAVRLILDAKHAHSWLPKDVRIGRTTQPVAVLSKLGWYLIGNDKNDNDSKEEAHVSDPEDYDRQDPDCGSERTEGSSPPPETERITKSAGNSMTTAPLNMEDVSPDMKQIDRMESSDVEVEYESNKWAETPICTMVEEPEESLDPELEGVVEWVEEGSDSDDSSPVDAEVHFLDVDEAHMQEAIRWVFQHDFIG